MALPREDPRSDDAKKRTASQAIAILRARREEQRRKQEEALSSFARLSTAGGPVTAASSGLCPYADAGLLTVGVFPLGGLTWCGPF